MGRVTRTLGRPELAVKLSLSIRFVRTWIQRNSIILLRDLIKDLSCRQAPIRHQSAAIDKLGLVGCQVQSRMADVLRRTESTRQLALLEVRDGAGYIFGVMPLKEHRPLSKGHGSLYSIARWPLRPVAICCMIFPRYLYPKARSRSCGKIILGIGIIQ